METTTATTVTAIQHTFAVSSLFPETEEGVDAQASVGRYAELVAEALGESYPEARITVTWIDDLDSVSTPWTVWMSDGSPADDDLVTYEIEPVIEPIFSDGAWVIEA